MISVWLLRVWHVFMFFALYAVWWSPIANIYARTHGFQSRGLTGLEAVGFLFLLMVLMWIWAKGGNIIKMFR